jgi:ABC-type Fe3+ transport system, periplasmic component
MGVTTRRVTAATAALVLMAAGCGGSDTPAAGPTESVSAEWQAVIEAAKAEGTVVWYSQAPPASREALKAAFEARYPEITVEIRALNQAEIEAALQVEHDTGTPGADVVTTVNYGWVTERLGQDGWFTELAGPSIAADEWIDSGYILDDKVVLAPLGLVSIGWNTQLFPEGISSYEDLLDPRLGDGAIGIVGPEPALLADFWTFIEENHVPNFVERFAAQKPAFYRSAALINEAVAAGEVAVGAFTTAVDMVNLQEQGAPIDFLIPDPAWTAQNLVYIVESAGHPNAAQLFVDFFASPEGQRAAAKYGATPLSAVAPETLGGNSRIVLTNLDRILEPGWAEDFAARWRQIYE